VLTGVKGKWAFIRGASISFFIAEKGGGNAAII